MTRTLGRQDSREVLRIVGFFEYVNALRNLDSLIKGLPPEQLKAIDDYVKKQPEFTVYVNLSRLIPQKPSTLGEKPLRAGDPFARRGLAWMTALARTEVGSMLAVHTQVSRPFRFVGPTRFDGKEYRELLFDGARTHYWALQNDRAFPAALRSVSVNDGLVAYSRRLLLSRALLHAAVGSSAPESFYPAQRSELMAWKRFMDGAQAAIVLKIQRYLTDKVNTKVERTSRSGYLSRVCQSILRAEKREIARGTAKVKSIGKGSRKKRGRDKKRGK